jgi:O-antigen ligase
MKSFADLGRALSLTNLCRLFALLLVAWQPFPGEYRVPLVGSALLGLALTWRGELRAVAEPAKRLGLLLLCLLIPGLLSIPTSLAPSKSWGEIASVVLVGLAGLSVLYGLRRQQDHRWLQTGLVIVIAAWIGDGLLQAVTGADVFGIVPPDGFITGPFRPNAIFGIILSILLPLVFWGPLKKREWWAPFLLCGTLVVIVLTGQRNNLLLAAIGLACISNLWSKRTRLVAASLFAATLIVTYPLSPALQERGAAMIDTFSQPPPPSKALESNPNASDTLLGKLNSLSSDRGYLLEAGIKMIQAQPISGIGLGAYKSSYPEFTTERPARKNIHAHNIYLGITAETGLLGLSAFLFAIAATSRWFLKSSPERQSSAIPYAYTLVVMLFPLATHTSLYRAFHFSIFLMVLCGFLSALYSPSIGECLNIDKEKDLASSEP